MDGWVLVKVEVEGNMDAGSKQGTAIRGSQPATRSVGAVGRNMPRPPANPAHFLSPVFSY